MRTAIDQPGFRESVRPRAASRPGRDLVPALVVRRSGRPRRPCPEEGPYEARGATEVAGRAEVVGPAAAIGTAAAVTPAAS
ncbi:MAG: hypothetical protein ACHRXM_33835 [Isosphaerales bacterium]